MLWLKKYPDCIKDKDRVNYPNVRIKDIHESLVKSNIIKLYNVDGDQLLSEIRSLNISYGNKTKQKLEQEIPTKDKKSFNSAYIKASKHQFFLGLKRLDWVYELINIIDKKYKRIDS